VETEFVKLTSCLACNSDNICSILDLDKQPLANDYRNNVSNRTKYELVLNFCNNCLHAQLSIAVNPDLMFKNYPYVTSTSKTMQDYFLKLSKIIIEENPRGSKILDIGSNDGAFLTNFRDSNWISIGVDPALNLISKAFEKGVLTIPSGFNTKVSKLLANDFDVVTAFNVFAHTRNPFDMLKAIYMITHKDSKIYIQTSQADMVMLGQFDTIYHEHINFFNVKSMKILLRRAGFFLDAVDIVDVHGGSYLWKISKNNGTLIESEREKLENASGFGDKTIYGQYLEKVNESSKEITNKVSELNSDGYVTCIYGSAAKGNTLLNALNIIPDYIFDDTPEKIGRYSPVGDIKVLNPKEITNIQGKILVIIPAWNLADEIINKMKLMKFQASQIKILTYYPELRTTDLV